LVNPKQTNITKNSPNNVRRHRLILMKIEKTFKHIGFLLDLFDGLDEIHEINMVMVGNHFL